jgi:hypothetical protein
MASQDEINCELNLLTEEYRSLKTEIVANLTSARQVSGLAFGAVGVLMAGATPIVRSGQAELFLVAPVLFYALAWAQLRYVFMVLDMGLHLRNIVAPRMRQLLKDMVSGDGSTFAHIMAWEDPGKSPVRTTSNPIIRTLFVPIAGANFAIPILAAVCSVGAFFVFHVHAKEVSGTELALLVFNVIAFIYTAAWGAVAEVRR